MSKTQSVSTQLSNKLYRGEVSSVDEALQCVVDGMNSEIEEERRWNASLGPDEQQFRWNNAAAMQQYGDTARQALDLWQEEMRAARERVIAQLRDMHTSESEQIADAIESEAWDSLAW